MIPVFTYYTNNGTNLKGNWSNFDHMVEVWVFAVKAACKYYGQAIINTDAPEVAKSIFDYHNEVTVQTTDFNNFTPFDPRCWNFAKIISYYQFAKLGTPFIHIDNDLILDTVPWNHQAPLICEAKREAFVPTWQMREIGIHNIKNLQTIACSGIMGGNNVAPFIELYERCQQVMKYILDHKLQHVAFEHLFILEEYLFTDIVGIDNVEVIDCKFTHYQGTKGKEAYRATA